MGTRGRVASYSARVDGRPSWEVPWWKAAWPFLVAGLALVVVALAALFWPTGRRALVAAAPELGTLRERLCRVRDAIEASPEPTPPRSPGVPLVLAGYVFLDRPDLSQPRLDSNTESADLATLRSICESGRSTEGHSIFPWVVDSLFVDPEGGLAGSYGADGVAMALEVTRRARYLVVTSTTHEVSTRVVDGTLEAGEIEGTLYLHDLQSGASLGGLRFRVEAPETAAVWVSRGARDEELSSAARANAMLLFERTITRELAAAGVQLESQ